MGSHDRDGGYLTLDGLYLAVLFVHSWLRWIVLVLGIAVFVRSWSAWRTSEPRVNAALHRGFVVALDTQLLIGLVLFVVLSPITRTAFSDIGAAMATSLLRFFLVEHVFGMAVAVIAAHIGYKIARGLEPDADPIHLRRALVAQTAWLLATLVSVPWPGLPYGRPLFRLIFLG